MTIFRCGRKCCSLNIKDEPCIYEIPCWEWFSVSSLVGLLGIPLEFSSTSLNDHVRYATGVDRWALVNTILTDRQCSPYRRSFLRCGLLSQIVSD